MPTIEYIAQIKQQQEHIAALASDNAMLIEKLNALTGEYESIRASHAVLKAERDEAKQSARRSAVEILAFMGAIAVPAAPPTASGRPRWRRRAGR